MVAIENFFMKYIQLRNKLDDAKIYKIVDKTNDKIYIGSTCRTLKARLASHKSDYKRYLKGLIRNVKSFDIIKNDNYEIELLENCEVRTKEELFAKERYYIENNNCLNKYIPGRTQKEYTKAHYITNKEKLNQKFDCQCGGKYTHCHKSQHIKSVKHQKILNL